MTNTIKLYLAAIIYVTGLADLIAAARDKIAYLYYYLQIRGWTLIAAYYVGKELKFQNFNFTAKFEETSGADDVAAWTDISNEKICVHFYIQDIIDTWNLIQDPDYPSSVSFGEFVTRLVRHELRHVWQAQNCFAMFLLDGQLPYNFQIRESDANNFAIGAGYAQTPEEFNDAVENTLRAWNLY